MTGIPLPLPAQRDLILGLDLGQQRDYSALVIAERRMTDGQAHYDVGHVERFPLNTRYPAVVEQVRRRIDALNVFPLAGGPKPRLALVPDQTGCGRPVIDLFVEARLGVPVEPVTITAGTAAARAPDGWHVPKAELAAVVQVILQSGRLRIADQLPNAAELTTELKGFRAKIKLSGHVSFEAGEDWRSAPHDDLVLALAMALWWGENRPAEWSDIAADFDLAAFFRGL
mgnify:CR=1 FL=1